MTNATIAWTDDRVALLGRLWEEGESASRIAGELGVSRNAVIGKVHRLGLPGRRDGAPESAKRAASGDRPDALKKPDAGRKQARMSRARWRSSPLSWRRQPRSGAKLRLAFATEPAEESRGPAAL